MSHSHSHIEQQIAQCQETIYELNTQANELITQEIEYRTQEIECREFMRTISASKSTRANRNKRLIAYFKKHSVVIDAGNNVENACYDCIEQICAKSKQALSDRQALHKKIQDNMLSVFRVQLLTADQVKIDETRQLLRDAVTKYSSQV